MYKAKGIEPNPRVEMKKVQAKLSRFLLNVTLKSSWKMPKDNCDSRVHLMLVFHANSLGFLSNPRVASLYKFFRDQPMS